MGLRQFFGLGGPLSARRIDKSAKLAANPFAQPEVRTREMQRLLQDKSPEAIAGVLRRFSSNAQGHIADEEEKRWLSDALIEVGAHAQAPLEGYIRGEEKLTYALQTYRGVVGEEGAQRFFAQVLQEIGPADYRRIEAKLQLVLELTQQGAGLAPSASLLPHLHDHSDDVRWAVLDWAENNAQAIERDAQAKAVLMDQLSQLVCDQDVSMRIARRAANLLATLSWPLGDGATELNPALGDNFFLDKKGYVRPRQSA